MSILPNDTSFQLQQALHTQAPSAMNLSQRLGRYSQQDASFTDLNSLQGIRQQGKQDQGAALEQIAKQFESILVQNMMKAMRQANAAFTEDSMFNSNEIQFHQDMYDQQLGLSLSQGRGMGLADALVRQLKQQYQPDGQQVSDNVGQLDKLVEYRSSILPQGLKSPSLDNPQDFIETLLPHAQKAAQTLGLDPKVLVAQAALETGWGQHVIHDKQGNNSHNLFNIKADQRWDGGSVKVPTLEYEGTVARKEVAAFRRYDSYGQSFADYVRFLQDNGRYEGALQKAGDAEGFVEALQAAGYATDPQYAKKIKTIFNSPQFTEQFLNVTLGTLAKVD